MMKSEEECLRLDQALVSTYFSVSLLPPGGLSAALHLVHLFL